MTKIAETVLACLVTFITLGAAHILFTWRLVAGKRIKPPYTYVVGVLMLFAPWAALMWLWEYHWEVVASLAAVVVSGGIAVGGGYHFLGDKLLLDENARLRARIDALVGGRNGEEQHGEGHPGD